MFQDRLDTRVKIFQHRNCIPLLPQTGLHTLPYPFRADSIPTPALTPLPPSRPPPQAAEMAKLRQRYRSLLESTTHTALRDDSKTNDNIANRGSEAQQAAHQESPSATAQLFDLVRGVAGGAEDAIASSARLAVHTLLDAAQTKWRQNHESGMLESRSDITSAKAHGPEGSGSGGKRFSHAHDHLAKIRATRLVK